MFFVEERTAKTLKELQLYIFHDTEPIPVFQMKKGKFKNPAHAEASPEPWTAFTPADRWGEHCGHFWFRTEYRITPERDRKPLLLKVTTGREGYWDPINPQFLVYVNGRLVHALDIFHREILLAEQAESGVTFTIDLHAYTGRQEAVDIRDIRAQLIGEVGVIDRETERLYYNLKVPLEAVSLLGAEEKRRFDLLHFLNEAVNMLDLRQPRSEAFHESVRRANRYLEEEFYDKYCSGYKPEVTALCVGHGHLDVAWGWTVTESREKAARTFSNTLNLMRHYPGYAFIASQPQLYRFVQQDYPEIYDEIRQRIREGRWEAEGGMWLEADCNLTSGESLVRQFLYGKRFFQKEFGIDCKILWLPDVFGYSAALPQILKKCGIDYFMTTKLGGNEFNKIPHNTFKWRGIDGTEVLAHLMSAYNGVVTPAHISGEWKQYKEKLLHDEVLVSFGFGDGGGGPTREMLEYGERLAKGVPGCPQLKFGTAGEFFRRLAHKVKDRKELPTWVGELYYEYHRGTYTSVGKVKRYNRQSEFCLQDAEFFSVMRQYLKPMALYPRKKLEQGWETVLLHQFHDILPGSSIKEVYEEAETEYQKVLGEGREIIGEAIQGTAARINLTEAAVVVFNSLGFTRSDLVEVELPEGWEQLAIYHPDGQRVPVQIIEGNSGERKTLFMAEGVPAKGYKAFRVKKGEPEQQENDGLLIVDTDTLENRFYLIRLDANGLIVSLYDKLNQREIIVPGGKGNMLQAFEDKPLAFASWNIDIFYQEKMWEVSDLTGMEVIERGPVRAGLRMKRRFMNSEIVQEIFIYRDLPRIDFHTVIDWKEREILLKAAFPVEIHADKATYEIQYGNVERPTHWNTSWDYAKFEVCGHKWADLSEDGFGVSLLNDCKYGYDIKDGVMRLTLLKSSGGWPYPDADNERHEFTYSLYPHTGDWRRGGTVPAAYGFNCPLYGRLEEAHPGVAPEEFSLVRVDAEHVHLEVVKKAEDGEEVVIRLFEYWNRRGMVTMEWGGELDRVWECNLLEQEIGEVPVKGNNFSFEIRPYEIRTFKVQPFIDVNI